MAGRGMAVLPGFPCPFLGPEIFIKTMSVCFFLVRCAVLGRRVCLGLWCPLAFLWLWVGFSCGRASLCLCCSHSCFHSRSHRCSDDLSASSRERVRLALHGDSFDANAVRARCMPWLLDPFSFLQGCSRCRRDAMCSVLAAFVSLVGASVADDAVPVGSCVFASGLVRRSLHALALSPASLRLLSVAPPPFRPARGAEPEAPLG
jgi:hypothetical protein